MTKEEFIENANLNDTYTAFVFDYPNNRRQYSEGWIDRFDENYLANTSNYSIFAEPMDSEIGQVICDNFAGIDQIASEFLTLAHFTAGDGTEVYILADDAQIF